MVGVRVGLRIAVRSDASIYKSIYYDQMLVSINPSTMMKFCHTYYVHTFYIASFSFAFDSIIHCYVPLFQVMGTALLPPTFWTTVTVFVFTLSWTYTGGGYYCSVPLALLLVIYVAQVTFTESEGTFLSTVVTLCQQKLIDIIKFSKPVIFLVSYWFFDIFVLLWFPYLERSNGAPFSLIFFSVTFVLIFITPTLIWLLLLPVSILLKWQYGQLNGDKAKSSILDVLRIVMDQWLVILCISLFVLLMFVFDADLTCLIRYTMKGKPCWPVLIPSSTKPALPYPLQHAWIKSWHKLFYGYAPGAVQGFVQSLGCSLGEVPTLLPTLIGVYVVSLLIIPSKHTVLRLTIFSCVAGVVLAGVFSASLKIMLHRYRPNAYGDPYRWTGPGTAVVNHLAFSKLDLSFPAGHTSVTSAVATSLYLGLVQSHNDSPIVWRALIASLLFMFPLAVLVSRVGDCYHWNSDATFGVSIFK